MRYILARNENNELIAAIWAKSQNRDEKNRECSHRDYLRKNNIPFEKVLSIGDVHCNLKTKENIVEALPWDGPEIPEEKEKAFLRSKINDYLAQYTNDLGTEIQTDWNNYQAYMERQRQFLASQGR